LNNSRLIIVAKTGTPVIQKIFTNILQYIYQERKGLKRRILQNINQERKELNKENIARLFIKKERAVL
jgi:hypothetical protein